MWLHLFINWDTEIKGEKDEFVPKHIVFCLPLKYQPSGDTHLIEIQVWTTLEWYVLNISEQPAREKIEYTVISYYISSFNVYLQESPVKMQIGCSESGMGASACLKSSLMLMLWLTGNTVSGTAGAGGKLGWKE